jgi:hypothetical protein
MKTPRILASVLVAPLAFVSCRAPAPATEAPPEPESAFEVRWTPTPGPAAGREEVRRLLAEPWGYSIDVYRSGENGKTETASMGDCASYFELSGAGYEARPFHEQLDVGADRHALRAIGEAAPSPASHLAEFRLDEGSVDLLPPDLSLAVSDDEARRLESARSAGRTWSEFEPIGSVTVEGEAAILVEGDGWGVRVELLAWGDFDGDGLEDVLAKLGGWLTAGSYRTSRLVVLTRRDAGARLELVREYELS